LAQEGKADLVVVHVPHPTAREDDALDRPLSDVAGRGR
jgi:hypothetical protein